VGGETAREWWTHTGALEAQEKAARAGGYGPFDPVTYFLHDIDPEVAAEGEQHQPSEADIGFGAVCDFAAWPAIEIRVLAGEDDRFFPVDLQRRVARDRLGIEVDVLPGGHLLPLAQPRLVADYLLHTNRSGDGP
jgi:pimeloyl-ACP methyl ester carboxylesterase